jgi:hypothetical protein
MLLHLYPGWLGRSVGLEAVTCQESNHDSLMFVDMRIIAQFIKKKSNKMQQCINILLFHIYVKLKAFWATHRPSSGA